MKIAPTFTARTVSANFAPWIVYGLLSATGHPVWAYVGGLIVSLCQIAPRWRAPRRKFMGLKIMDGVSLLFFLLGAVSTLAFHSPLFPHNGSVLLWSTLAVVAWGSLLAGSPFTAEYAREAVPQTFWNTPSFRRVNAAVTEAWGTVFVVNAALALVTALNLGWPSGHAPTWLGAVPYVGTVFGIVFTNGFPQWVSRQEPKADQSGTASRTV